MEFIGTKSVQGIKTPGTANPSVSKGWTTKSLGTTPGGAGKHSTKHTLLSLYAEAPAGDITLEEFEKLALDRLRGGA